MGDRVHFGTHDYTKQGWDALPQIVREDWIGGEDEDFGRKRYLAQTTGFNGFPYALPRIDASEDPLAREISKADAARYIWRVKKLRSSGTSSQSSTTTFDKGSSIESTVEAETEASWNFSFPTGGYVLSYDIFTSGTKYETSTGIEDYDHAERERDLIQPQTRIFTDPYYGTIVQVRDRAANFATVNYLKSGEDPITAIEMSNPNPQYLQGTASATRTATFTYANPDIPSDSDSDSQSWFIASGLYIKVDEEGKYWLSPPELGATDPASGFNFSLDPDAFTGNIDVVEVGTLTFEDHTWPIYGEVGNYTEGDFEITQSSTVSVTYEIEEYWPYANNEGFAVWNTQSGQLISSIL